MGLEAFNIKYAPVLKGTRRWDGFQVIAQALFSLNKPAHIVETGCIRKAENWEGDGGSTLVWDFIAQDTGGTVTSIDISPDACALAKSLVPSASVITSDSVAALLQYSTPTNIDLLYLDSLDWDGTANSVFHNLAELSVIYPKLKSGTLIAIDDCIAGDLGKGVFVTAVFDKMGIEPLYRGYVSVWRKP